MRMKKNNEHNNNTNCHNNNRTGRGALQRELGGWERDQELAGILRRRCGLGKKEATGWVHLYVQELDL